MSTLLSPDGRHLRLARQARPAVGALGALAWAVTLLMLAAPTARADDVRAERARIAAERAAVEARHSKTQSDCARRFVVTSCADEARQQRRLAIEALNRQTLAIDESERRREAAGRLRSIDAKAAAHAGRQASGAASSASTSDPAPVTLIPRGDTDASRAPRTRRAAASAAAMAQQAKARDAAARVTDRDERRKDADAHRAAVERRLKERQASGRAAARLPDAASGTAR